MKQKKSLVERGHRAVTQHLISISSIKDCYCYSSSLSYLSLLMKVTKATRKWKLVPIYIQGQKKLH